MVEASRVVALGTMCSHFRELSRRLLLRGWGASLLYLWAHSIMCEEGRHCDKTCCSLHWPSVAIRPHHLLVCFSLSLASPSPSRPLGWSIVKLPSVGRRAVITSRAFLLSPVLAIGAAHTRSTLARSLLSTTGPPGAAPASSSAPTSPSSSPSTPRSSSSSLTSRSNL